MTKKHTWSLIQCSGCAKHFGKFSNSIHKCPYCGDHSNEDDTILISTNDQSLLGATISELNTPLSLKTKIHTQSVSIGKTFHEDRKYDSEFILECLQQAVDEKDVITKENLVTTLISKGVVTQIEKIMEEVEFEGLLLRIS
ncbi:uncharacterized protein METZ01_LOCUS314572, partial [marine metagenome]